MKSQSQGSPYSKRTRSLADTVESTNLGKRFFLLPRPYTITDKKSESLMKTAARTYISKDLDIYTLLQDSSKIFELGYIPNSIYQNETKEKVENLDEIPADSYLYVRLNTEPSFKSKRVKLYRNVYPKKEGKTYHTKKGGIDQLLKDAKKLLNLPEMPNYLFDVNGHHIKDIGDLSDTNETEIIVSIDKNCVFRQSNEAVSTISQVIPEKDDSDDIYNYIIGMSNMSISTSQKLATFAAYQTIPEHQRKHIPNAQQIKEQMKEYYQHNFNKYLAVQMMIPPLANQFTTNEIVQRCIETLSSVELNDIKFTIGGPNGSGKSTYLYLFANTLFRKLMMCDEEFNYLFFPMNFESFRIYKDDPHQLYNLFIETGFEAISYTRFDFIQHASVLKQYLLQLPIQMNLKKPPANFSAFEKFSNDIVKCFQNGGENFPQIISQFPGLLAKAVGLNLIFIIDHFDSLGEEFCVPFARVFSKSLFILSAKNDKLFYEFFKKVRTVPTALFTEKLIEPKDQRVLTVPEFQLQLKAENCLGSPAFLVSFTDICDAIEKFNAIDNNQNKRGRYSAYISKAHLTRKAQIRQNLSKLCIALSAAGLKSITQTTLTKLADLEINKVDFKIDGEVNRNSLSTVQFDSDEEDKPKPPPRPAPKPVPMKDNSPDSLKLDRAFNFEDSSSSQDDEDSDKYLPPPKQNSTLLTFPRSSPSQGRKTSGQKRRLSSKQIGQSSESEESGSGFVQQTISNHPSYARSPGKPTQTRKKQSPVPKPPVSVHRGFSSDYDDDYD